MDTLVHVSLKDADTNSLPESLADIFITRGVRLKRTKGQPIVMQADETTDVYYIQSGMVEVSLLSPNTKEFIFREIPAGHLIGEMSAIDGGIRSVTVEALTTCELYKISGNGFLKMLEEEPKFRRWLNNMFVGRIRNLTDKLFEQSTMTVPCRIWLDLLRRAQTAGIENDQAVLAALPSQRKLASYLGTHREAIAREFSHLANDGLIEKLPDKIIKIVSVKKLQNLIARMTGT